VRGALTGADSGGVAVVNGSWDSWTCHSPRNRRESEELDEMAEAQGNRTLQSNARAQIHRF
jgi:hypothetical protein